MPLIFAIAALLLLMLVAARGSIGAAAACEPLDEFAADRVAFDVDARNVLLAQPSRCVAACRCLVEAPR